MPANDGLLPLFPKAYSALSAICAYPGYPEGALHHAHRRFFYRHLLIETHAPGLIRCTAKGAALTRTGAHHD
jgi:hypothetical protein